MLRRGVDETTSTHGFLIAIELSDSEPGLSEAVAIRLADGPSFMEGVGKVDVEHLGKLDIYDAAEAAGDINGSQEIDQEGQDSQASLCASR